MAETQDAWPAGATWVFQGTVAEDATAGTHVCTLTVSPGAGNEMEVLYCRILAGAGAANLTNIKINDGTNVLSQLIVNNLSLASGEQVNWPTTVNTTQSSYNSYAKACVSGTMNFVLSVSTATVSLVHTFAVVCRIKGAKPTATLNDTIGTSTNTVNTNQVF
jgi:hypothetical protein